MTLQLDKTFIAIRERGAFEIFDLALHVAWARRAELLKLWVIGVVPLLLLNHLLLSWLFEDVQFDEGFTPADLLRVWRYVFNTFLLIFLEAPLGTAFMTLYLGRLAFEQEVSLNSVFKDFRSLAYRFYRCQLIHRLTLFPIVLLAFAPRTGEFSTPETWLFLVAFIMLFMRGLRPYLSEIILLERNPLKRATGGSISISDRNRVFHSGDANFILTQWMVSMLVSSVMFLSLFGLVLFVSGVLFNAWVPSPLLLQTFLPLTLWFVAGFMAVARYLGYLDLRIRQEGWEVDLQLRAEAQRLHKRVGYA